MKARNRHPASLRTPLRDDTIHALQHVADGEWRGIILFGIWIGRRLADIVQASWRDVNLEKSTIRLGRGKLGRADTLPLAPALRGYFEGLERPQDPKAKVFPIAAKQSLARLNDEFRRLAAKVRPEVWGFDALRLTFAFRLEWESIPGIAQMLGHQSPAQGLVYTYTDENTLKAKLAKLQIARPKPERKGGLKP